MNIVIPTFGRIAKQTTFESLPEDLQKETTFVVRAEEYSAISNNYQSCKKVLVQKGRGIANARQAAVDYSLRSGVNYIIFLDDDLKFAHRISGWSLENAKLQQASRHEVGNAIAWMVDTLTAYAVVGIGPRGGNNRKPESLELNTRIMRSFGVNLNYLRKHSIRVDKFYYWEDFHIALSLLEIGYPNISTNQYTTDGVTNATGGVHRDIQRMEKVALAFAKEHPTATIVHKRMPAGEKYQRELLFPDFRIGWKKALGIKKKSL